MIIRTKEDTGAFIKINRVARGFKSQSAMNRAIGLSDSSGAIGMWEKGTRDVQLMHLVRWANALGCDLEINLRERP